MFGRFMHESCIVGLRIVGSCILNEYKLELEKKIEQISKPLPTLSLIIAFLKLSYRNFQNMLGVSLQKFAFK